MESKEIQKNESTNSLEVQQSQLALFDNKFESISKMANVLCKSTIVPDRYRGEQNFGNCFIAVDMSMRMGMNPLMVMQNLYEVHGTPSWSSKFLIAAVNACGRFTPLMFEMKNDPQKGGVKCRAYAVDKATGDTLYGTWITWEMVQKEGWASKNGSKWITMPEQMFRYRAASFWQKAYAPEISMGFLTQDEVEDNQGQYRDGYHQKDDVTIKTKADADAEKFLNEEDANEATIVEEQPTEKKVVEQKLELGDE